MIISRVQTNWELIILYVAKKKKKKKKKCVYWILLLAVYICIEMQTNRQYPANKQRRNNVVTTSLQRHDVAATL